LEFWNRGSKLLTGKPDLPEESPRDSEPRQRASANLRGRTESLADTWRILVRRCWFVTGIVGGLLLLCLLYCLVVPNQYEARARVALRTEPAAALSMEGPEPTVGTTSLLTAPLQLETLANVFRSDRLAWRVIAEGKLYQAPGFQGGFQSRFPGFRVDAPSAGAQAWLLERFQKRLRVQTIPRTLLIQIRFRSRDPVLSATVVNALIHGYREQESEARQQVTTQATGWLESQLKELEAHVEQDRLRLETFQNQHGILTTPETLLNGQPGDTQHNSTLLEIDELGRQLVASTTDRILREAEFQAASQGNPELVFASSPDLQAGTGGFATALLEQIRARRSELEQEQTQLGIEHGPNFPRVVEIHEQLQDLDRQKQAEDAKLVERFRGAWQTALDREQMVRKSLDELTAEGLKQNQAATEYAVMRQEANSSHDVYMRVMDKVEEAGIVSGISASNITVVDYALQPVKPVTPDLPLYMAITLFTGLWLALGGALLLESIHPTVPQPAAAKVSLLLLVALLAASPARAQAPTPSTSGLPSGVTHVPAAAEPKSGPNPKDAPAVWENPAGVPQAGPLAQGAPLTLSPMAAPIGPGDLLDISEYHTPEFHSVVRVSSTGSVTLPLVKEVHLGDMDEQAAAQAIEAALVAQGMLLHPQVSVLVTLYAGQDVSVLGEVTRPGVYPYTLHHRLLDLISAASGLAPTAGRLVNIFARSDPKTPHPVVLDPSGTDTSADHNPELAPGDTVQVSRAGLVYVIGDVVRPGGFPVDPAQGLTVVQALSLAWGPAQNAATSHALLIREQKGGRTLTTLNLSHMLHGQEPDQPIRDRDILFVPDSMAKNLWNKSLEAAIQSTIGISIYAGLVYSQRF
jgi:polysaccharide export outer membrane protein